MTESDPRSESSLAILRTEFGDRLDDAGITRVREQLAAIAAASAALAAVPLANGDEPMVVFHPQTPQAKG